MLMNSSLSSLWLSNEAIVEVQNKYKQSCLLASISKALGTESITLTDAPSEEVKFLATLKPEYRKQVLQDVASTYYIAQLLDCFYKISYELKGVISTMKRGITFNLTNYQINELPRLLDKVINGAELEEVNQFSSTEEVPCIKTYLEGIINRLIKARCTIRTEGNNDVNSYLNSQLTSKEYRKEKMADNIIYQAYNVITSTIYLLNSKGLIDHHYTSSKEENEDLFSIFTITDKDIQDAIAITANGLENFTTIALEDNKQNIFAKIWEQVKAIFRFLKDKIMAFFRFIKGLFIKRKEVKEKIEEEYRNLTPEEKKKADDVGKPIYTPNSDNTKVYGFDKNGNYLVTIDPKSSNPFKTEPKAEVEKKIESGEVKSPKQGHNWAALDLLLLHPNALADTTSQITLECILRGMDPSTLYIHGFKAINDYLNRDYNHEVGEALTKASNGQPAFNIDSSFPKLKELLDGLNKQFDLNVESQETIPLYSRVIYNEFNDRQGNEIKYKDDFKTKLKSLKMKYSYEDFVKESSLEMPKLNESLFKKYIGNREHDIQTATNYCMQIFNRLCYFIKGMISRLGEFYQLVYIPFVLIHDLGEIADKAAALRAAKKREQEEADKQDD
jgi:hypothetical protein